MTWAVGVVCCPNLPSQPLGARRDAETTVLCMLAEEKGQDNVSAIDENAQKSSITRYTAEVALALGEKRKQRGEPPSESVGHYSGTSTLRVPPSIAITPSLPEQPHHPCLGPGSSNEKTTRSG